MGFFNRFRKKDEDASVATGSPGKGETMSGHAANSEAAGAGTARADAAKPAGAQPTPAGASQPPAATAEPQVKEVSAEELKARIEAGSAPLLIDVREPWEHQIVNIESAQLIPMNSIPAKMDELDKNAEIVVYCHHGQRSWNVAAYMLQHGFTNVKNLTGGIDAWARRIDKTMRTY